MTSFRIAREQFINNLTGEGAGLYGGRWNLKGTKMLCASQSRSLATVEYLVHIPISMIPDDLCIAEIELPDMKSDSTIDLEELPEDWRRYPAPIILGRMGSRWVRTGESLILKVPSAVVEEEWNILINPAHPDFRNVRIRSVNAFRLDERLIRKSD